MLKGQNDISAEVTQLERREIGTARNRRSVLGANRERVEGGARTGLRTGVDGGSQGLGAHAREFRRFRGLFR